MISASIVATMTTAFSTPEVAFEWKLLHCFWGLLVIYGASFSLDALAQALACERSQIMQVLDQYPEAQYDPSGNLIGCEKQFFFANSEVVAPWVSEHADFLVFPLEEACAGMWGIREASNDPGCACVRGKDHRRAVQTSGTALSKVTKERTP
jgi:hypothetical protein